MDRARMASEPLPLGVTDVKIVAREWGFERWYKNTCGEDICTPALFERFLTTYKYL